MNGLITAMRKHPTGFWFIFWGELAERSSFYGMRVLLALYLVSVLKFSEDQSGPIIHTFTAFCYLLPILGGYIADRWLGKFRTIIYFAVPYICGHLILGSWATRAALFVALALLAGGSGAIKPNISPLMGKMYDEAGKPKELRAQAFAWFYGSINIGAALSMLTLPFVRDHWGYSVAFMFPTVLMAVSLLIFYLGKKYYPKEVVGKKQIQPTYDEQIENRRIIGNLMGIFVLIIFFWAIFDQAASTWVYFARDYMTLYGLAPDALQGINPVLVVILVPLFAMFWPRLGKRQGHPISYTQKMMIGFVLVIICMAVMGIAGYSATVENKVSVIWMMVAYVIITLAELCISVVGLEMAYAEAPDRLKSTVTALFLFTVFIGNLLAGFLSHVYPHVRPGNYFMSLAGLMLVVAVAFYFVAQRFEARKRLAF